MEETPIAKIARMIVRRREAGRLCPVCHAVCPVGADYCSDEHLVEWHETAAL